MQVKSAKFVLFVQDMERAVAFYRDAFGCEAPLVTEHWSELAVAGVTLGLHAGGSSAYRKTGLSLQVDDLAAACAEVTAKGGRVVREPQERPGEPIALATVADPEGNGVDLVSLV